IYMKMSFLCFFSCLLLATLACSQALEFSSSLRFKSLVVGQDVTLQCFSKHSQTAIFYWYKQTLGQRPRLLSEFFKHGSEGSFTNDFKNDPRFLLEIGDTKNHLTISNAQTSDSGTYYCVGGHSYVSEFYECYSVLVEDSSSYIQTSVDQSSSENIHAGDSVTLNCTVHTGSCDGEHRVYWFKDSGESHPGLIYTHGGRKDQCERNNDAQTHSCVYELSLKNLTESHAGIYYCAVASCGHILFGNRTKLDFTDHVVLQNSVILHTLVGLLTIMSVLVVFLLFLLWKINKRNNCTSTGTQTSFTVLHNKDTENLHYAAINVKRSNRSRQKNDLNTDCVYASVRPQN
uniref:Immunoglobulin kappa light chain-like n=1 Tax=Oryzias melastigma TaxID=30732 RepID=A0A3B3CH49_ORYME